TSWCPSRPITQFYPPKFAAIVCLNNTFSTFEHLHPFMKTSSQARAKESLLNVGTFFTPDIPVKLYIDAFVFYRYYGSLELIFLCI
ncbi:hypothetical protein, partial [Salmonella sp. s55004]|uniref:hypothetical protein n=1 Tax=Salmonella sp. s55004 TaxID=3159675 RepID=UPI0039809A21